jgi:2,3-diketo-5-methylthio-1-phosphopentane phosphatase
VSDNIEMNKRTDVLDRRNIHIFSDFDGTITEQDTIMFLTRRLGAGDAMVESIGHQIRSGEVSIRDGIAAEMHTIRAPFTEAERLLREHVRIDPGFPPFVEWCLGEEIPLTVLSGGFQQLLEIFLPADEYTRIDIRANRLNTEAEGGWLCEFRDDTPYGHDKGAVLLEARARGQYTIFIGDGLSDRAAADVADEVFAKHTLAEYCQAKGIFCHEFDDFAQIHREIAGRLKP